MDDPEYDDYGGQEYIEEGGTMKYSPEEGQFDLPPAPAKTRKPRAAAGTVVKKRGEKVAMMGSPDINLALADPLSKKVLAVSPGLQRLLEGSVKEYEELKSRGSAPKYGGNPIFPFQFAVAGTFAYSKGVTKLFMEKGVGKTIMAFEAASQITARGGLCLIAVPQQTLKTWRGQGLEAKLIDKDPKKTRFFIFDPAEKQHFEYLTNRENRAVLQQQARTTGLVIIAKDQSTMIKKGGFPGAMGIFAMVGAGQPLSIIVDEGHTPKRQVDLIKAGFSEDGDPNKAQRHGLTIARILYMSGSKTKMAADHWIDCYLKARAPIARWHIELLPPVVNAEELWEKRLSEIFRDNRHVIVSSDEGEWINIKELIPNQETSRAKGRAGKDHYIVLGPGKANPEREFADDSTRTAYHLTTRQGKGMNLLADAMIINSVEGLTIDSLIQLSYRPLRPNNPYAEVNIYVFVRNQSEYYKAYYASAFSYNGWELGYDDQANPQFVSKAVVLPRTLGYLPDELGTVDRVTVMANYIGLEVAGPDSDPNASSRERLIAYMHNWRAIHLVKLNERTIFEGDAAGLVEEYWQ